MSEPADLDWYDRGGSLPPGISLAYNDTDKPEPVNPGDEER